MQNYEIDVSFLSPYSAALKLMAVNAAALFFFIFLIEPLYLSINSNRQAREVAETAAQTARLAVSDAQAQQAQAEGRVPEFRALLDAGLFDDQDRLVAARRLESLRLEHGLGAMRYEFGTRMASPADHGFTAYRSAIRIEVEGRDDRPILDFMNDLPEALPGTITIDNMELRRNGKLTADRLSGITRGSQTNLAIGEINLIWQSLSPADLRAALSDYEGGAAP